MIKIRLCCAMCGRYAQGDHYLDRSDNQPHYDFERDLKRIVKKLKWVYQDDVVGDIYCSKKCAS